ncbi:glycosyl hydrolase [Bacteroidia bacterium]|nr:glycosyl hydrolase [Bacteroidia bacterium]
MKKKFILCLFILTSFFSLNAQEKLYKNAFPLSDVKLLDGPFKHACELNLQVLLQYDVDRLLAPYLHEAGLPRKAEYFPNWQGLDGHIAGHYLSALAIHYAATGNRKCKERMEYVLSEMKRCQDANGNGYVGGVPDGRKIWDEIKKGNPQIVFNYWVPWYNVHKTFAGLRDAWLYAGNEQAKDLFLKMCDWGISVTGSLSDEQMKSMVAQEYGGMNEIYADAYQITKDEKYLKTAKRFGSDYLYDDISVRKDNLDNKHANTQVPKAVGYQRTAEVSGDPEQKTAAEFFFETVVYNRSLSFGGNSRREHFPSKEDCISYMEDREGPESCNTYNMLKLAEGLFRMNPQPGYADYYERALFNHILSTQHPEHGGYVYFTPARSAHYRVYSSPNSGMWCCVGTGMENHGKYGAFIYTHSQDSLYVNLFAASELNWKDKSVKITQHTRFPEEEGTTLTVNTHKSQDFTIMIRCPWWVQPGNMEITCNGKNYAVGAKPSSYVAINRKWKNGDVIKIKTPMKISIEELPNEPGYISILHGPVVLGAKMGTQDMKGLVADDSRWGHIAHGSLVSMFDAPPMIGTREEIRAKLENRMPVAGKPLHFTVPGLFADAKYTDMELEPFYNIHDSRYMIYWLSANRQEYDEILQKRKEEENRKLILDSRTIDAVKTAEQQPEIDHLMKQERTGTGVHLEQSWRETRPGGYFQYEIKTDDLEDLSLMVRYWGKELSDRAVHIYIDGQLLTTDVISGQWDKSEFVNVEYAIPAEMLKSKKQITVKFTGKERQNSPRIFYVRLLKKTGGWKDWI